MGLLDDMREATSAMVRAATERLAPQPDVSPDEMRKSLVKMGLADPTDEKPRALFHDPYSVYDWGGWRERPSALTYDTLRQMSSRNTVIAAIIQVRVNQVGQFARPQQGRYDKGYKVVLRDRRDDKRSMSPEEQMQAAEIERMLETTGRLLPDEKPSSRDSFRTFMKKATRDVLIYDQFCFEKIRDRKGRISRFKALPSETIRPAVIDWEHTDAALLHESVTHVQVWEDTVMAEFSPDDIAWCVMNPRSDLRSNSFGYSFIEQLTNLITSWLYGFEYNTRFFTQGSAIKGILNVKGAIPDRQLKAFRRMWYSMVTGVQNSWRTPILNSDDLQWIPMHSTNREMEYSAWMDWLTKLTCAVFGIDPVEINFQFGNTGQTSSLNTSDNEKALTESKDKGLRPLMEHLSDCINSHIIWEINPDFEFVFAGLDAKSEQSERDGLIAEVGKFMLVDEVRAVLDKEPLPNGLGQVILDPTWLQFAQGKEEGGDEEGEGEDGPLGGDGPMGELEGDEDDQFGDEDDSEDEDYSDDEDQDQDAPEEDDPFAKALSSVHYYQNLLRKAEVKRQVIGDRQVIEIDIGG